MANDPVPATQDPFSQAEQPQLPVAQTPFERLNTGSGSSMIDQAVQRDFQQRQAQANLYQKNAADIHGLLFHLADPEARKSYLNPKTGQPYTDSDMQELQDQLDHATGQYEKLVGVDKESKGALQKAKTIIDFVHGRRRAAMQPPPTPQYGATVTDNGVIPTPMPGTNVGEHGVAITPQAITPPPLSPRQEALRASSQMPFAIHPAQVGQAISDTLESRRRTFQQDIAERTEQVKRMGMDPQSPTAMRYIATGTFPPVARLQLKPIEISGPDGKPQRVMANYDPIEGTTTYQGKVIDNPQIADKPQLVKYMKTDTQGKQHLVGGFMLGTELFDQQMNPLPPNTEFYSRGLQGRDTLHQSITMGPDGKPIITTLESVSNPTFTKAIWGDEPSGGTQLPANTPAVTPGGVTTGGPGASVPSRPTRQGGTSPAPRVAGGGGGGGRAPKTTDAAGRPLGLPPGQFTAQSKAATGVDQARNSLVGDNIDKGEVSGLAKDLGVFKSQDSMKRIGEYLQLVHNQAANEGDSFAHSGDTFGAVKWFAGLPQLNISLQQGALRDQYGELTTDEKKFVADYFRVMGTMGGMRASTGMPGYQWAFTNMYNEMPTPGKVNDYNDAVRRLMNYVNETNVVSKRNSLVSKVDVQDAEKQIRGGSTSKGAMTAPLKANSKAINF